MDADFDLMAPAAFSPCGAYRYTLARPVSMFSDRVLVSCGFNPSLASQWRSDPTITREITLAERLECGVLLKINCFAAVSPYPDELAHLHDPVGPDNDAAIRAAIELAHATGGLLLACWGTPKGRATTRRLASERFKAVASLSDQWHALRITQEGHPEHPLYLPDGLIPIPWPGY